jgi:hypothetical protein
MLLGTLLGTLLGKLLGAPPETLLGKSKAPKPLSVMAVTSSSCPCLALHHLMTYPLAQPIMELKTNDLHNGVQAVSQTMDGCACKE